MDKETVARALEPFFSTKGIGTGTGLGLSIVDALMSQCGGALALKSELGHAGSKGDGGAVQYGP
jgi:signal transduction histidine kinase